MANKSISRGTTSPGTFCFIVDFSGSTARDGKYKTFLRAVFECLDSMVTRCTVMDQLKERFKVYIIGFNSKPTLLFQGGVQETDDLLANYTADNFLQDRPEVRPEGLTCAGDAIAFGTNLVLPAIEQQRSKGQPVPDPIFMMCWDGFPEEPGRTDAQARNHFLAEARRAQEVKSDDGHLLFFNIHFEPGGNSPEFIMPASASGITDEDVQALYEASSEIPEEWVSYAHAQGFNNVKSGCRGMISNAHDYSLLTRFIQFGTITGLGRQREREQDPQLIF